MNGNDGGGDDGDDQGDGDAQAQAQELEKKLKELQAQQEPPRHIGQGILNGVGAAAAGIAAGAVGLVAAPIAGAAEEGGVGFIKGLAVGAAGAIAMPALGVAAGGSQVVQGAMNTPAAVNAQLLEKVGQFQWVTSSEWGQKVEVAGADVIVLVRAGGGSVGPYLSSVVSAFAKGERDSRYRIS